MIFLISINLIAFCVVVSLLLPRFLDTKTLVEPFAYVEDLELLKEAKKEVIRSYDEDESRFKNSLLTKGEWVQRKRFLIFKYVDIVERIDQLVGN